MVLPVVAAGARGAAALGGRAGGSGAARGGSANTLEKARQARRDVRSGRTRDKQGRNAQDTKFTGEKPSAMLYLGVSMIALLKDLLDFVGVGSLPGIGFVVTACFSFLIWILLVVFDNSSKGTRHNMRLIRGLVVIAFAAVEGFAFGLNFLPIETTMVIVLYHLARRVWKKEEEKAKEEKRLSAGQEREKQIQEARQARMEEERAQQERAQEEMMIAEQQESAEQQSAATGRRV